MLETSNWVFETLSVGNRVYVFFAPKEGQFRGLQREEATFFKELVGGSEFVESVYEVFGTSEKDVVSKLEKAGLERGEAARHMLDYLKGEGYFEEVED
ncbi:MAG: hypothetical protein HYX21_03290 [Candidatus Yanofskybacteria bacterium]|nr:hypothetical protein [Candidatus Yanofskybacteria bacterium]